MSPAENVFYVWCFWVVATFLVGVFTFSGAILTLAFLGSVRVFEIIDSRRSNEENHNR